jgi:transcription elongation factor Elf1
MERLNEEIQGDKFQCRCGNTEFEQDCFVKTTEQIDIVMVKEDTIIVVSKNMKDLNTEDFEYTSEFTCPKCNKIYEITKRDGKDFIVDLGED